MVTAFPPPTDLGKFAELVRIIDGSLRWHDAGHRSSFKMRLEVGEQHLDLFRWRLEVRAIGIGGRDVARNIADAGSAIGFLLDVELHFVTDLDPRRLLGGPNFTSSFHASGVIFDKVYDFGGGAKPSAARSADSYGTSGGAVITEFKPEVPATIRLSTTRSRGRGRQADRRRLSKLGDFLLAK